VRLLDGAVAIESAPGEGTHIAVELPLADIERPQAVIFDMDGVLVDTYQAHYQSWLELAEAEGFHVTEAQFAALFGRTSPRDHRPALGRRPLRQRPIARVGSPEGGSLPARDSKADFPAMPGAERSALRSFAQRRFPFGVGSSGSPENVAWSSTGWGQQKLVLKRSYRGRCLRTESPIPKFSDRGQVV